MFNNFITELLGIKEWYVEVEHAKQTEQGFVVELGVFDNP